MTIAKILVPLGGTDTDEFALTAAFGIAKSFGGHVDALFVRPDPADAIPTLGEGMTADVINQIMESSAAAIERANDVAKNAYEAAIKNAGAKEAAKPQAPGEVTAGWRDITGRIYDVVPLEGRVTDLTVVGHDASKDDYEMSEALESALFDSGRPVLMVPKAQTGVIGKSVAIAWDGSPEAARAVGAARPFLAEASTVNVITVTSGEVMNEASARLVDYLAWRGVKAEAINVEKSSAGVGAAVLSKVDDLGADLLVMGGYAHSRIREMIFGGTTRHIVSKARLPVLMSH